MTFAFFVAFKIYATSHVMLNTISSNFETSIFLAVQSDNSVLGTLSYIFRKKFRDKLGTFFKTFQNLVPLKYMVILEVYLLLYHYIPLTKIMQ